MYRRFFAGLAIVASVAIAPSLAAQVAADAPSDSGIKQTSSIMRVTLYRWAEGMQAAGQADMRMHLVPVWEAQKQAGILLDYSTMTNLTASGPEDWQFGVVLVYKNFAAMDSLGARNAPITLKHYGTAAARTAAGDARAKLRKQISTNLVNGQRYSR